MKKIMTFFLSFALNSAVQASTAYGTLNNFDCVNDTEKETHGFEIEVEDIHSTDITYTYDFSRYGKPTITEDNSNPLHPKVIIRYASPKDVDGKYINFTAIPANPIQPTDGHQCTNTSTNIGCEHFGLGYAGTGIPTFHWLVTDAAGNLIKGAVVNIATPVWNYTPPVKQGDVAKVVAQVDAPRDRPDPSAEFGEAVWVREIVTKSHKNAKIELKDLVSDDPKVPDDKNWANGEAPEVEVEWDVLQTDFSKPNGKNNNLRGRDENMPKGDEVITRRYEFFKYIGPLDPENGEALCETWMDVWTPQAIADLPAECVDAGEPIVIVGDYIGAQMAGFNPEVPLGLIDNIEDGAVDKAYTSRRLVIGGNTPYVTKITTGALPSGLSIDSATGVLSGTPTECGVFSFTVDATDTSAVHSSKNYVVKVISPTGCALSVINGTAISGEVGVNLGKQMLVTGGLPPYIIDVSKGSPLLNGLTINAAGELDGKPTQAGTANVILDVTDTASVQSTGSVTINIAPAVSVIKTVLPLGKKGAVYKTQFAARHGIKPFKWLKASGKLPDGLVLKRSGLLSGRPKATGRYRSIVKVVDKKGMTATRTLIITVLP